MRKRILSGMQPTGELHLGNYLGALANWVRLQDEYECFFCIVDQHAITVDHDPKALPARVFDMAVSYLAAGIDPERATIFVQSAVPEHTELAWYLNAVTQYGELSRMTQFKDKSEGGEATAALFTYPVLMAADILIVRADKVPVGKDQKQHLEVTRDVAAAFNHEYGEEVLKLPEPMILPEVAVVPGIDGRKMSKSYGNTLDIFAPEAELRKRVMSIVTDSTPVEEPKPTRGNTLYHLLKLFTPKEEWPEVRRWFTQGGTGYGKMKQHLLGLILDYFREARARRQELLQDLGYVERVLQEGKEKAQAVVAQVMADCRRVCGLAS